MSDRHAETRRFLQRVKLGGTVIAAATAGLVTAAPFLHGAPAPAVRPAALELAAYSSAEHPARPASVLGLKESPRESPKEKWRPSAEDALHLALAQVGVAEDTDGGGTIYQKWFVSSPWAVRGVERDGGSIGDYANANWCDMFISWIGDQLGVRGMGADAFTPTHAQWFEDRGRWGQTPTPGAVVFFSWSGSKSIDDIDHVGMVIKDNHDGTIQTVEGNTDNAVKIRTRDVSNVVGYGYPDYAPASPAT